MRNIVGRLCWALVASALLSGLTFNEARAISPSPVSGDVFREYAWKPATGHFNVLNYQQSPLLVEGELDLTFATSAELIVEIANAHLGFPDLAVQVNDKEWRGIEFPNHGPKDPSPALWFFHWYPTITVPLSDLRADASNRLLFRIGKLLPGKWVHPPWTPVYGATLRVHYDPAKKPHPVGAITFPAPGAKLGDVVELSAKASSPNGAVKRIEFIGYYEGVNPEGDGLWEQWHYTLEKGNVRRNLATVRPGEVGRWDTSWLPDQPKPMQVVARIVDNKSLVSITAPIENLTLARTAYSVELVKPTNFPAGFTNCQYGLFIQQGPRTETLNVAGDLTRAFDARVVFSGWNAPAWRRFSVNGRLIDEVFTPHGQADGNRMLLDYPLRPLTVLKPGDNELSTTPGPARQMDIHFPGVALLVKYLVIKETADVVAAATLPAMLNNKLGMSFVRIAPGTFVMGSAESVAGHMWEERQYPVQLTKPYFMATKEVTQSQFQTIMGRNPSHVQGSELPVTQVTWQEAVEFCRRLSKQDGKTYRLPTEAQWEYAARAGTTNVYATGDAMVFWQANFDPRQSIGDSGFRAGPTRVGQFAANAWGLHDMQGNVWEWASDWYGEYPAVGLYEKAVKDPRGAAEKTRLENARILRGGAWDSNENFLRPSYRWRVAPNTRLPSIGFRVVMDAGKASG